MTARDVVVAVIVGICCAVATTVGVVFLTYQSLPPDLRRLDAVGVDAALPLTAGAVGAAVTAVVRAMKHRYPVGR